MPDNLNKGAKRGVKFHRDLSDEQLFLVRDADKLQAENELCRRYIRFKRYYLNFVSDECGFYLDEISKADAFMIALAIAVKKFDRETDCLFKTFFISVLRHELLKICREHSDDVKTVSLEARMNDSDDGDFCLSDVIPAEETPSSSPKLYVGFQEIDEAIRRLRRDYQPIAKGLVKYLSTGSTLRNAANQLNITYARARYVLSMIAYELEKRGITL